MVGMSRTTLMNKFTAENIMLTDEESDLQDIVTPYAIRNLTDRDIKIYPLKPGSDETSICCEIEVGKKKGIAVNFENTL